MKIEVGDIISAMFDSRLYVDCVGTKNAMQTTGMLYAGDICMIVRVDDAYDDDLQVVSVRGIGWLSGVRNDTFKLLRKTRKIRDRR
jgi:hypothetical protein